MPNIAKYLMYLMGQGLALALALSALVGCVEEPSTTSGDLVSPDGGARLEYHSSPNDIELTVFDILCDGRDAYMEFEADDSGNIWEWGLHDDACGEVTYVPVIDNNIQDKISFSVCTRGEVGPDRCSDWFTVYI
jgi:hypothetical protein